MVNITRCYFDNKNYYFADENDGFTFFTGSDMNIVWRTSSDYQRSYLLLVDMLQTLKQDNIVNIKIYHNTRIVEEIKGTIRPMNQWGENTLAYIRRNLLPYFIDYYVVKMSAEDIQSFIKEGEKNTHSKHSIKSSELLEDAKQKRLQKFKQKGR